MNTMSEVPLLSGKSKEIEQLIVGFYATIGKMVGHGSRPTEIFAYLKIYDELSQEQLKKLTGFSLSTISTILQSFLQADVVIRSIIQGTHKNLYRLKSERVKFTYLPHTQIIEDLEKLDLYLIKQQENLQNLEKKHPIATQFLYRRLNSLRNYIEAQRRAINRDKRFPFFQEDLSEIISLSEMIVFPFQTNDLENDIMGLLRMFKNDPIGNRILSIFITHRSLDQDSLVKMSGLSRSTVSRYLRRALEGEYIRALPREYRKPQIYYLESMALSILSVVKKTDEFTFSYIPIFQEILQKLHSEQQSGIGAKDAAFLLAKCEEILKEIEFFKDDTRFFRQAYSDFRNFLGKGIHEF